MQKEQKVLVTTVRGVPNGRHGARAYAPPQFCAHNTERGSVGTGTDERIRQERPTSTGFCIGDARVVRADEKPGGRAG